MRVLSMETRLFAIIANREHRGDDVKIGQDTLSAEAFRRLLLHSRIYCVTTRMKAAQ
jgi:hypothetical protein